MTGKKCIIISWVSITLLLCTFLSTALETKKKKKNALLCKNVFTLVWGGFRLVRKRITNESCDFVLWDGKTRLTSRPISFHSIWNFMVILKSLRKVCHQSIPVLWSYMTAFTNSRHPTPKATTTFTFFFICSLK